MLRRYAGSIMVQPRTLLLEKPIYFFLEPMKAKRAEDAGNDKDSINGPHQVDPHRFASCAPVMPNLALYASTGNPYPDSEPHDTVQTTKRWAKFVKLSHAMFIVVRDAIANGKTPTVAEMIEDAVTLAGVGRTKSGTISVDAQYAALDTMRDLRLYGVIESEDASSFIKKTKWSKLMEPANIGLLSGLDATQKAELAAAA
jgi:hypothetical protein